MHNKAFILLIVLGLVVGLGQRAFSQKEQASLDQLKIERQLDQVLANQAEILKQFEEIKQELEIIKVRASR
ncbi:hypothetical protein ACFL1I_04490 [Candidatus Omnitrophota bacterium]